MFRCLLINYLPLKKTLSYFILAFVALAFGCQSPASKAMKYNDEVIERQEKIIDAIDSLEQTFKNYQIDSMREKYNQLKKAVNAGNEYIAGLESFDNDSTLVVGAKDLFSEYQKVTDNNYPIIIEILSMPDSVFTRGDQQRLFDQQTIINDAISQAHQAFLLKQKAFGKKHNLTFTEQ